MICKKRKRIISQKKLINPKEIYVKRLKKVAEKA